MGCDATGGPVTSSKIFDVRHVEYGTIKHFVAFCRYEVLFSGKKDDQTCIFSKYALTIYFL